MANADYGRQTLRTFGFIEGFDGIEPGTFVIGDGPFQVRKVPSGEWPYVGIALDRTLFHGLMQEADMPPLGQPLPPVGRMGRYVLTPQSRPRIGHDGADRAWDTAAALTRLLDRFNADRQHAQTGFIADHQDGAYVFTTNACGERVRTLDVPMNAIPMYAANGWVYSSHFREPAPAGEHYPLLLPKLGLASGLTLVGQIECLWAVLRDRLSELLSTGPAPASLNAIPTVAGRLGMALDWTSHEIHDLERVRGELWAWSDLPTGRRSDATHRIDVLASARVVSSGGESVPLTADHDYILALLGNTPTRCMKVHQVASAGRIRNRETSGQLLRELEEFGLVARPHGPNKGYTLTSSGRRRVSGATPT